MFSKSKKIILIMLSIILVILPMLAISVNAEEPTESNEVLLIVRPNVDPRVVGSKATIRVEFMNQDTGDSFFVLLKDYNDYCEKVYVKQGPYIMISGDVGNDYEMKYEVKGTSFFARGHTVSVSFDVGDPSYTGPVEENTNAVVGDIDHSRTNELLEEDGQETINWEQLKDPMNPLNTDPNNPYLGINNEPLSSTTTVSTTNSETTDTATTEPTTEFLTDKNNEYVTDEDGNKIPVDENGRTEAQKKRSTIITLIIIVLIIIVVLYFRYKNADVFVPEDEERV